MEALNISAVQHLLGIHRVVPLTHSEMIEKARVTFFPAKGYTPQLTEFMGKLRRGFETLGVKVLEFEEALAAGEKGKVARGVAIIAGGDLEEGQLPIDFVPSLSENIIIGVYDRPSPINKSKILQERIDVMIGDMAWDVTQVAIYLGDGGWTVCTMNGAMILLSDREEDVAEGIRQVLLAKMAGQVLPPRIAEFEVRLGGFDPFDDRDDDAVADMVNCGARWEETRLFVYQTALGRLKFRNKFYRRLISAFVDNRTGMSYGFIVRQLPVECSPALSEKEATEQTGFSDWETGCYHEVGDKAYVCLEVSGERLIVPVPDVWVLGTRSGCVKTRLDPSHDILRTGLSRGRFILESPKGLEVEVKPSYDTGVIMAHALGNALVGSLLARLQPESKFLRMLRSNGLGLAHWHGYLATENHPPGYAVYGKDNVPFPCSTPQSAILALECKLAAFQQQFDATSDYEGDIHVEPHHGTNMACESLVDLAGWLLQNAGQSAPEGSSLPVQPVVPSA
jgi:hypothetical protein